MKLWRYGQSVEYLGRRYRLDGMLGSGGMADVCLAWDEREQREVAVKVLKSDDLDQETLNRFMKEAAQIAHWQHPHILRVYESLQVELIDAASGAVLFYMVSEYARGGDLQKRLTQGRPFPLSATFALFRQLCDAVQYAHEHGVIHRDLKPLNMLFRRPESGPEEVVLSDFGLAVQADASHHTFARGGTLAYMAPEQFQGHALPASDIFALGVILYLLCTGGLPFRRSLQDIPRVVQGQAPLPTRPSLLNAELPPALDAVILRAMHDLPAERYCHPREFWQAIELALTTNARTFPFSDFLGQNAGQTWPYDGSEQPQRSRQAGQHELPPVASGSLPSEEMAEVEEGPVSALWIAREKQKASPVRLSLPTNSILMTPNVAEADEQTPSAGGASSTWQPGDDRPPATPGRKSEQATTMELGQNASGSQRRSLQRRPDDSRPTRTPEQSRRGAGSTRAPGSRNVSPFTTPPPSDIFPASAQADNQATPPASTPGSTILPAPLRSRHDPAQTSRRQSFSDEPGYQTDHQAGTSFDDESERQSSTRRASRQPASDATRSQSQRVSEYNSYGAYEMFEDENDTASSARQPGVPGRRSVARRQSQKMQTGARSSPTSQPVPRRQARDPWQAAHLPTNAGRSKRRGLLLSILGGLALLGLLFALFAATSFQGTILTFFGAPITRVTIQPRTQLLQEDVTRAIVISGQPAPGQIPGRHLTVTSATQTATANATGSTEGRKATGQLTFINNTSFNITIQSTIISDKNGVQITFAGPLEIPANPPTLTVLGTAVNPGTAGNISTLDLDQACCAPNGEIFVKNTAFTGGQDAQKNSVIQQKDIDGAAKGLITSGQEQALATLREQLRSNERVAGEAQCQPQINADQKAGALAKKATVQVAVTCSETVYDYDAARQSFTQDLQNLALSTPTLGTAYALAGQIAITRVSPAPGTDAAMLFHTQGLWVYQFTKAALHDLTTRIAGQSQDAARTLLLRQPGILSVQFSVSGSLPVNTSEIQLIVQTPPPASA